MMNRIRIHLTRALIAIAIIGSAFLLITRPAEAHVVTNQQCYQYGSLHHFTTGASARVANLQCRRKAARHAIAHAVQDCLQLPSDMGASVCSALAWTRREWAANRALHELLRRESSWSPNAVNESSGACGLFQRLPCPWEYYGGGGGAADDRVYATALAQAHNGVRYIDGRYGTPERALAFHDSHNWY